MIRINKSTIYFILIIVLVLVLFKMQSDNQQKQYQQQQQQYGYDKENNRIVIPPIRLSMSPKEAELTKSAVALVEMDIHKGCIDDSQSVISALRANLPDKVAPKFLAVLGCPPIEQMKERLNALTCSIVINPNPEQYQGSYCSTKDK